MTTVNRVLARCARLRGSGLEEEDRARFVLELDERIYAQVTGRDEPHRKPLTHWPGQGDEPLLVQGAYRGLYDLWLQACCEFAAGNYEDYNDLALAFDRLYAQFRAHWRQTHRPGRGG